MPNTIEAATTGSRYANVLNISIRQLFSRWAYSTNNNNAQSWNGIHSTEKNRWKTKNAKRKSWSNTLMNYWLQPFIFEQTFWTLSMALIAGCTNAQAGGQHKSDQRNARGWTGSCGLWVEMEKGEFHFSLMKTMRNLCGGSVCDGIARRKGACLSFCLKPVTNWNLKLREKFTSLLGENG
jgi:hypothetical protein